ncbi:MAG: T9SS type A sorting domain-containing protein [candidate division WOR-3 bacterium]|nr:T9SS type A sorting domain-containing protein [candidate division WOR-3 bacterium]
MGFVSSIWAGWAFRTPMRYPRYGVMVASVNNRIYAIGGFGQADTGVRYVEEYNPVLDTWILKAPMPTSRGGGVCAVVNNKIYVIGGNRTRNAPVESCEVYDPQTNQWQRRRRLPTRRYGFAGSVIGDSIYVLGGFLMPPHGGQYTDTVEVYLPSRDSWFVRKSMITPRVELGCAQVNNKIYAIGGVLYGYTNANEQYYPDTWIAKRPFPEPRSRHSCAVFNNNIYVIGGRRQQGPNEIIYARVDVYNPILDTWTLAESLNVARYSAGATVLNGSLYVIGGFGRNVGPIASVEQYITTGCEEINTSPNLNLSSLKIFPNPLKMQTTICYEIKQNGNVVLSIYDVNGNWIKTLINQYQKSGIYSVKWNGTDKLGKCVAQGIYFVKLSLTSSTTNNGSIEKILVLR